MLRSMGALVAIVLALAVGYFVYTDRSERSGVEKARAAAEKVGEKFVDHGVAGLVKVQLGKELGIDAARFLHVHHERGHALIYGLLRDSIDVERVRAVAAEVPGVKSIEIRVMPREPSTAPGMPTPLDPLVGTPVETEPEPDGSG